MKKLKAFPLGNLPEELQNKLGRALDDYKSGRYITNEQMKRGGAIWINKRG